MIILAIGALYLTHFTYCLVLCNSIPYKNSIPVRMGLYIGKIEMHSGVW